MQQETGCTHIASKGRSGERARLVRRSSCCMATFRLTARCRAMNAKTTRRRPCALSAERKKHKSTPYATAILFNTRAVVKRGVRGRNGSAFS